MEWVAHIGIHYNVQLKQQYFVIVYLSFNAGGESADIKVAKINT